MADVINATPTYTGTPVLSKVKIGGTTYHLKDADARSIIDIIYGDYLKSADKTELLNAISAEATARGTEDTRLQGLITTLEGKVGTAGDEASATGTLYARIKKAIEDLAHETGAREDADRALGDRLNVIEGTGEGSIKKAVADEAAARDTAIENAIKELDVDDTAETGKYVSAVKEVDGKIQVTRTALPDAAEYSLEKEGTTPEGLAARYYLTKDNVKVGEYIDIAKDQFLKDATFIASATEADKAIDPTVIVGDPYIKFTFQTIGADRITYVAVKGLVDVYTEGNGIDITDNVVTAVAKSGDKYIEVTADGIASKGIDDAIADAVADEEARATAAEEDLSDAIEAEETRAKAAEQANTTAIEAEVERATAAETANANAIATEKSRAEAAEGGLDTRLTTAEGNITTLQGKVTTIEGKPAYNITDTQIANWDNEVGTKAALATEVARAEGQEAAIRSEFAAADTTLDGKITAEATARANADDAINAKIGAKTDAATAETVYGAIAAEKARAEAAEADLQEKIDDLDEDAFKDVTYVDASHKLQKKIGTEVTDVHTFGDLADENLANLEVKGQTKNVVFTSNSVDVKEYTVADAATATAAELTRSDYKPAGDVTVTLKDNTFNAITSVGTLPTYTDGSFSGGKATVIDTTKFNGGSTATFTEGAFTPATLTYAASDEFVKEGLKAEVGTGADSECLIFSAVTNKGTASVISAFNGGSKAADTFNGGSVASLGDGFYTAGSDASYTAPVYVAGTLPQMASQTVAVNTAAFDGTTETGLKVTGVNYKKQVLNDSTVTKTVTVAGTVTTDDKAVTKKSST